MYPTLVFSFHQLKFSLFCCFFSPLTMGIYGSIKREEKMKFLQLKSKKKFSVKNLVLCICRHLSGLVPNKPLAEKDVFVIDWAPAAIQISVTPQMLSQ